MSNTENDRHGGGDHRGIDMHTSESLAFRESLQCSEEQYCYFRSQVIKHLKTTTGWDDKVDLSKTQIRKLVFEDGVISYEATHPAVTHEDEIPEDAVPIEEFEGTAVVPESMKTERGEDSE